MEFTVNLGKRSYPILLENGSAEKLPDELKKLFPKSRFALVTNTTIAGLYRELIAGWKPALDAVVYEMPDGEEYKTIGTWNGILDFLLASKLERSSIVIALGGGVVGDVAGFAAATFLRGVGVVQVPTTLLAMVDSSVGGKTAVDHPLGKNLIGAFHQPKMVLVDNAFLATLPQREFMSGYAELFKYAFIGGREMFDFVRSNHALMEKKDPAVLLAGISRSIAVKAGVVEQDEHETGGLRALLNFGHTFAHALERYFDFKEVLHGEAVWWGMHCAISCAALNGMLTDETAELYGGMRKLMPDPRLPERPAVRRLYDMMFTDKKVTGGALRLVLPTEPGTAVVRGDVPAETVLASIEEVLG
ncbi:MAG: 3-dehydroquinate synthase [Chitinispirillaceae bacterium]|nr:3-dehydroquinate synthase [Chitinispirillaceae bacterium]